MGGHIKKDDDDDDDDDGCGDDDDDDDDEVPFNVTLNGNFHHGKCPGNFHHGLTCKKFLSFTTLPYPLSVPPLNWNPAYETF